MSDSNEKMRAAGARLASPSLKEIAPVARNVHVTGKNRAIDFGAGGAALGNLLSGGTSQVIADSSLLQIDPALRRKIYSPAELLGFLGVSEDDMPVPGNVDWKLPSTPVQRTVLPDEIEVGNYKTTLGVHNLDTGFGRHWYSLNGRGHFDGSFTSTSCPVGHWIPPVHSSRSAVLDTTDFGFLTQYMLRIPSRFDEAWDKGCLWVSLRGPALPPGGKKTTTRNLIPIKNPLKSIRLKGSDRTPNADSDLSLWTDGTKYTVVENGLSVTPTLFVGTSSSSYFLERGLFNLPKWKQMTGGLRSDVTPVIGEVTFDLDGNVVKYHGADPGWQDVAGPSVSPCRLTLSYQGTPVVYETNYNRRNQIGDYVTWYGNDAGWDILSVRVAVDVEYKSVFGEGGYSWYIDWSSAENQAFQDAAIDQAQTRLRELTGVADIVLPRTKLTEFHHSGHSTFDKSISGYSRKGARFYASCYVVNQVGGPATISKADFEAHLREFQPEVIGDWEELVDRPLEMGDHAPA